jgi:hypothetical protein
MISNVPPEVGHSTTRTTEGVVGHQVNFYLAPTDTVALEQTIRTLGPLLVLHSRSPGSEPRVLESVSIEENGQPWLFVVLVRPEDLQAVVTRHVPAQGYWTIDVVQSPVIEFTRCFFNGTLLRRGRLYYVDGFYDANDTWQDKRNGFRQWAKAVLAKTKKGLKKHKTDYIGTGAEAWLASNGGNVLT